MEEKIIETEKKPNMLAFKSALSYSVYFLVLIYIFKMIGLDQNNPNTSQVERIVSAALSYIPFFLAIVFVQTTYKSTIGGFISFGKAFSAGFKVAAYTGLFIAIILIIYYKLLDAEAFKKLMDDALAAAGDDENKRKGVEMMKSYMIFFIAFGAAITYTFIGLVASLVGAALIKKERTFTYED